MTDSEHDAQVDQSIATSEIWANGIIDTNMAVDVYFLSPSPLFTQLMINLS